MLKAQSSIIELLITCLSISACVTILIINSDSNLNELRIQSIEVEGTLINYLKHKPLEYNETISLLIKANCNNQSFYESDFFNNKTIEVIESLNDNNNFILLINISDNSWLIHNHQPSVCLKNARLAINEINTPCGQGIITYGSWSGEAPLKC